MQRKPSVVLICPSCKLVNAIENKYCSTCIYPLSQSAFDKTKKAKNIKTNSIQKNMKKI